MTWSLRCAGGGIASPEKGKRSLSYDGRIVMRTTFRVQITGVEAAWVGSCVWDPAHMRKNIFFDFCYGLYSRKGTRRERERGTTTGPRWCCKRVIQKTRASICPNICLPETGSLVGPVGSEIGSRKLWSAGLFGPGFSLRRSPISSNREVDLYHIGEIPRILLNIVQAIFSDHVEPRKGSRGGQSAGTSDRSSSNRWKRVL